MDATTPSDASRASAVAAAAPAVFGDAVRFTPAILRGRSDTAARQLSELAAAAADERPVVIVGEPGLEAEAVARALHDARGGGPFVVINCGAAPAGDLHARLFGGAEAAVSRRRDLETVTRAAALVSAGTIVLDDVVELPAAVQRRLARILRDGEMYVTDARRTLPVRARLVATAAPDIQDEVTAGRFRADLYRRIAVQRIVLAPLRERPADIPEIVRAIADEIAAPRGTTPRTFTPAALTALAALPWTRNVEELRELLDRLPVAEPGAPARQEDVLKQLGFGASPAPPARFGTLRDARKRFEREYIASVLAQHQWRISDAAATLGIERANLYRKIRQLGLSRPSNGAP